MEYPDKKWNILAIDDSKLNRAIIKNTLLPLNMKVDEASDGAKGLKALDNNNYDLILVDIIMPNLDGFEFLSRFKKNIGNRFIPTILMTGLDDLNSKIEGLQIGADDYLLKPLNEKELVARVQSLLRLKTAHDELYEKNKNYRKELFAAKKIQEYIIPSDFSRIPYPRISGRYLPIEDIGGDFFDCYSLPDSRYGFIIADVTGHGIPAALVMTMSKLMFSEHSPYYSSTRELLTLINSKIMPLLLDDQYITAFYLIYDHSRKILTFTNAGHTHALYYRASSSRVLALDTEGLFIGITDSPLYEEKSLRVETGDRLFLYTDGISELKGTGDSEFGENRLAKFIMAHPDLHGEEFCARLIEETDSFSHAIDRNDDIAFLNIEF